VTYLESLYDSEMIGFKHVACTLQAQCADHIVFGFELLKQVSRQ